MEYAYERVDEAHRDLERDRLVRRLESLEQDRLELATEIGETAKGIIYDRDAGDLYASLGQLALLMADMAKLIDEVGEVENELRLIATKDPTP